jgi:cytochrome c554/c'-like protein
MRAALSVIVLACLLAWATSHTNAQPPATNAQPPAAIGAQQPEAVPAYAGAEACKSCHQAIYSSWLQTKHARTLGRLSKDQRESGECIRCHVTGTPELIAREGASPSHPNVECEACHGPGSRHAADATVRAGIRKVPGAAACEACHNDKSPHFRGFVYAALAQFSHAMKK